MSLDLAWVKKIAATSRFGVRYSVDPGPAISAFLISRYSTIRSVLSDMGMACEIADCHVSGPSFREHNGRTRESHTSEAWKCAERSRHRRRTFYPRARRKADSRTSTPLTLASKTLHYQNNKKGPGASCGLNAGSTTSNQHSIQTQLYSSVRENSPLPNLRSTLREDVTTTPQLKREERTLALPSRTDVVEGEYLRPRH